MSDRTQHGHSNALLQRAAVVGPALALALLAAPSEAMPILDQSFDALDFETSGVAYAVNPNQSLAQTFTVGVTGLLTRVDLQVRKARWYSEYLAPSKVLFEIMTTSDGVPDRVLGTFEFLNTAPPWQEPGVRDFFTVDMAPLGLAVTAGDVYALALRKPSIKWQTGWLFARGNHYECGNQFSKGGPYYVPLNWSPGASADLGFRTWVDGIAAADATCPSASLAGSPAGPSAVPEPSTLALAGAGLILCAGARRRSARALAPA